MNGLELSRAFYEEHGRPMLEKCFPELLPYIAVGFVGAGSERYGFDDPVSRDHDFEPGFSIFLPDEEALDRKAEFELIRAYLKLPKEFMGYKRQSLSPVGGDRNGVIRTADFYEKAVGAFDGDLDLIQWLRIPESALFEATDGEVFFDDYGEFSFIRQRLLVMPEDVRKKRLAGNLMLAAQSGQYNYSRCKMHGENEAAALALNEFCVSVMKCIFLMRKKYMPYYKWSFRALRQLDSEGIYTKHLSSLLLGTGDKASETELLSEAVIGELSLLGLSDERSSGLEAHAYSVNKKIKDGELRNMSIFAAV